MTLSIPGLFLAAALTISSALTAAPKANILKQTNFDPVECKLPDNANVCIVVEGAKEKTDTSCTVYAFEKTSNGWKIVLTADGYLGSNGMNNYRKAGDCTTPIGVFKMNTPFGQKPALEGFPKNYIQVDNQYVWSDDLQKLVRDTSYYGEKVGDPYYAGYYDYCIDLGYNPTAIPKKGNALFLHCRVNGDTTTHGCVEIDTDKMIEILKLYGKYEDGTIYCALYPKGKEKMVYGTYGIYKGLSPNGDFYK